MFAYLGRSCSEYRVFCVIYHLCREYSVNVSCDGRKKYFQDLPIFSREFYLIFYFNVQNRNTRTQNVSKGLMQTKPACTSDLTLEHSVVVGGEKQFPIGSGP